MSERKYLAPDVGIASSLAVRISLLDVSCVGLSAKLVSEVETGALSYELEDVRVIWRLSGLDLIALFPLDLVVRAAQEEAADLATISALYRIDYQIGTSGPLPDPEQLAHYVGLMGYMHVYPYFRADVQYLTAKLGFPALTLPVVLSGHVPRRVSVSSTPVSEAPPEGQSQPAPKVSRGTKKSTKAPRRRGGS